MTLRWLAAGDTNYAGKAIAWMRAWATNTPKPGAISVMGATNTGIGMIPARGLVYFCYAYDLLRSNPTIMSSSDQTVLKNWMCSYTNEILQGIANWNNNDYYDKQYYQNHCVAHSMGMIMLGILKGDQALTQYGVDSASNPRDLVELISGTIFRNGETNFCYREGQYANPVPATQAGEVYDRYRHYTAPLKGLSYSSLSQQLLLVACEALYRNGVNMYTYTAPTGENLKQTYEFHADFYRLYDLSIKGGYFLGEESRIGVAGDDTVHYELANLRYPGTWEIQHLLYSKNRPADVFNEYLGAVLLTHGTDADWLSLGEFKNEDDDFAATYVSNVVIGANTFHGEGSTYQARVCRENMTNEVIDLAKFKAVEIRIAHEAGCVGKMRFYWNRAGESYSESRTTNWTVVANGNYTNYTGTLSNTNWTGILDDIRIDICYSNNNSIVGRGFNIDSVRLLYKD
jgi:hypothetical protein